MIEALAKGDEVVTAGGVLGRIAEARRELRHGRGRQRRRDPGAARGRRPGAAQGHAASDAGGALAALAALRGRRQSPSGRAAMNRYPALEVRAHRRRAARRPALHAAQLLRRGAGGAGLAARKATLKVDTALRAARRADRSRRRAERRLVQFEGNSVKARFADTDTQLKAKDALAGAQPDPEDPRYIVALNLISRSPPWLTLDRRAADVPGPGPARRRALPAAGRHEGGARQGAPSADQRHAHAAARQEHPLRRHRREGNDVVVRFRDARDARQPRANVLVDQLPDLQLDRRTSPTAASSGSSARSSPRRSAASRSGASSRTSRCCATASTSSASPSRSSSSRASTASSCSCPACRTPRAPRTSSAAPRRSRCAWSTRSAEARSRSSAAPAQVPFGSELFIERDGSPVLVQRQVVLHRRRITDAQPGFDRSTNEPAVTSARRPGRAHLPRGHAREHRQAHGDPAVREGQGRGHHRAGDPRRARRRASRSPAA